MIHSAAWLLIFPVLFVCAAILWYRAERNGSLRKRVLTGFLALVFSLTLTVLFAVSITQFIDFMQFSNLSEKTSPLPFIIEKF